MDLSYTYTWDRPIGFDLSYNQVVYNMLLPDEYIKTATPYQRPISPYMSNDIWLQEWFSTYRQTANIIECMRVSDNYIRIPSYDIHDNADTNPHMTPLFSNLSTLGTDLRCLGNLKDLDSNIKLNEMVLKFLEDCEEYKYITTLLNSIFNIQLMENDVLVNTKLIVDEDLNVCSTIDLDVTKSYRFIFSYMTDITDLTPEAIDRLKCSDWIAGTVVDILTYITGDDVHVDDIATMVNGQTKLYNKSLYFISSIITKLMKVT
jgi:hypothetical protein